MRFTGKGRVAGMSVALALLLSSVVVPATAASGQLSFTGAVTGTTCDVYVEVNGVPGNVVNLGSASGGSVLEFYFTLKPRLTSPGCMALTAQDRVTMTWSGDFSSPTGFLAAQSGEASDATVYIMQDQKPYTDYIMRGSLSAHVDGETFLREGGRYMAALIPGHLKGVFQSAAAFVMVYD